MQKRDIWRATSARLEERDVELQDGAEETFMGEWDEIEKELDARYYANHPDARVRQAMGA